MFKYLISPQDLQQHRPPSGWLIFDVRHNLMDHEAGRAAYLESHIPGALFLDNETQLAGDADGTNGRHPLPDRREFAALMRSQGLTSRTQVVIYDAANGLFAARLWWMLRWLGHESVAILDGGWQAWVESGGKTESGERSPHLTEAQVIQSLSVPSKPLMPTVRANDLLSNLGSPSFTVVDARAPERYRGEVEPMDPIAGHIPDALNRPHTQNLNADGKFKTPEQLKADFEALLGETEPSDVVHQCGSGITACHNLFAMELAGLKGSVLYPGSWSEWVSDSQRPVAKEG